MSSHLRHIGNSARPLHADHSTHPEYPYSAHSTRPYPVYPSLPVHPYPTHSVHFPNIHGVHRFSSTRITRMAGISEGPLIRRIASSSSHKSLQQPIRDKKGRRTTIEMLSEDILLEIFDFYRLDAMQSRVSPWGLGEWQYPWEWHRLAHICRKWQHVISISPRRLDLRILCRSRAPIESILDSWPTLPLFVRYYGPGFSLPNNVIISLCRPDRVCEIDLVLSNSSIGPIVKVIQEPLQVLECIRITVVNPTGPPILVRGTFLGSSAPRLREIRLDGISFPFPTIQQVLASTNNLVDLHLSKISGDFYFSPCDLATALSTLVQLQRLTVGFHSPASFPTPSMTRPPYQRPILPALSFLDFHGASEYLEELVARINFPALYRFIIKLFNDIFFEIPKFYELISRLNRLESPTTMLIEQSAEFVNIFFFHERKPSNETSLGTKCGRLDWQVSFVTQISSQLSPFLSSVHSLSIRGKELTTGEEDVDPTQWLELFLPFTHVTQVNVWEMRFVPGIVQALVAEDMTTEVLPELTSLHLNGCHRSSSVAKAAEQFVTTRRLSGRVVHLTG